MGLSSPFKFKVRTAVEETFRKSGVWGDAGCLRARREKAEADPEEVPCKCRGYIGGYQRLRAWVGVAFLSALIAPVWGATQEELAKQVDELSKQLLSLKKEVASHEK